jgi:uncharacterized protein (TIGR02757 family)
MPAVRRAGRLAGVLERLYRRYNRRQFVATDPLRFVYDYRRKADREIAAFLCACLAYGRVAHIQNSLTQLLSRMGPNPFDFTASFDRRKAQRLDSFRHRFTSGSDIADLLLALKAAIRRHGSIEGLFSSCVHHGDPDVTAALSRFRRQLLAGRPGGNGSPVSRGLAYLVCDPAGGSACKRLNLFLRWMVRRDEVDPGLWKSVDKAGLIVPVDTHMSRLCRILRLSDRKTASLAAALEITKRFAEIEPADPVKYDFALSRIGIVENCTGRFRRGCEPCDLAGYCLKRQ